MTDREQFTGSLQNPLPRPDAESTARTPVQAPAAGAGFVFPKNAAPSFRRTRGTDRADAADSERAVMGTGTATPETAVHGRKVLVDDPWGFGRSLEWATSCPPPRHNFTTIPRIRSEPRPSICAIRSSRPSRG